MMRAVGDVADATSVDGELTQEVIGLRLTAGHPKRVETADGRTIAREIIAIR